MYGAVTRTAVHDGLYDPNRKIPSLIGTRCEGCQATFFPPLHIGCEICGAPDEQLRREELPARGVLHSVATVYLHQGSGFEAPFAVGEIQLDSGPLIRATLDELLDVEAIGARMDAQWFVVGTADDGSELVEPRFVTATGDVGP